LEAAATVAVAVTPLPVASPFAAPDQRRGAALVLVAIILIAVNLRVGVTSLGALLGEVGAGLKLNAIMLGVVTALPTAAFAAFGGLTPRLVRRIRPTTLLAAAMVLLVAGQLVRAVTSSVVVFVTASALGLAGVAVCNILLPMLVKRYFPARIGLVTAIYTVAMVLSGTVAAATAVPLAEAAGWRAGLGLWAVPALLALIPVVALRQARRDTVIAGVGPAFRVGRTRLGWALAVFFGMQAFSGFAIMGWLPQIYRDAGFSAGTAGLLLAAVIGAGVPVAFVMPWLAARQADQRPLMLVLVAASLVAYLGLAFTPRMGVLVWTGLLAIGQGSFPLALALVGLRSRTPAGTVALSAFSQSTGYLLATVGPLAIGLLYHTTGGWGASFAALFAALAIQAVAGLGAARPRMLEDETRPSPGGPGRPAGVVPLAG
jgi:CP family cyanate transporter-like MFS transporter